MPCRKGRRPPRRQRTRAAGPSTQARRWAPAGRPPATAVGRRWRADRLGVAGAKLLLRGRWGSIRVATQVLECERAWRWGSPQGEPDRGAAPAERASTSPRLSDRTVLVERSGGGRSLRGGCRRVDRPRGSAVLGQRRPDPTAAGRRRCRPSRSPAEGVRVRRAGAAVRGDHGDPEVLDAARSAGAITTHGPACWASSTEWRWSSSGSSPSTTIVVKVPSSAVSVGSGVVSSVAPSGRGGGAAVRRRGRPGPAGTGEQSDCDQHRDRGVARSDQERQPDDRRHGSEQRRDLQPRGPRSDRGVPVPVVTGRSSVMVRLAPAAGTRGRSVPSRGPLTGHEHHRQAAEQQQGRRSRSGHRGVAGEGQRRLPQAVDPSTRCAVRVIDVFTTVVPPTSAVVVDSVGTVVDSEGSTEVGAAVVGSDGVSAPRSSTAPCWCSGRSSAGRWSEPRSSARRSLVVVVVVVGASVVDAVELVGDSVVDGGRAARRRLGRRGRWVVVVDPRSWSSPECRGRIRGRRRGRGRGWSSWSTAGDAAMA